MWSLDQVALGDYIEVQIVNKQGDRNLDGGILKGRIVEINAEYGFAKLESGWCAHTKNRLLIHDSEPQPARREENDGSTMV